MECLLFYFEPRQKVHIHFRKFSANRMRSTIFFFIFFCRKSRTAHAVRGKFSVPWKIFWSVYAPKCTLFYGLLDSFKLRNNTTNRMQSSDFIPRVKRPGYQDVFKGIPKRCIYWPPVNRKCRRDVKRRYSIGRKWRNTSLLANGMSSFFFVPREVYPWLRSSDSPRYDFLTCNQENKPFTLVKAISKSATQGAFPVARRKKTFHWRRHFQPIECLLFLRA